jgi:hypothetical protein
MKYILNSAVITSPGMYSYNIITAAIAEVWLKENEWISTIGYEETAIALHSLTGVRVPVSKVSIKMMFGDEALVFRLTSRLPPEMKGNMTPEFVMKNCEIGLLCKI